MIFGPAGAEAFSREGEAVGALRGPHFFCWGMGAVAPMVTSASESKLRQYAGRGGGAADAVFAPWQTKKGWC